MLIDKKQGRGRQLIMKFDGVKYHGTVVTSIINQMYELPVTNMPWWRALICLNGFGAILKVPSPNKCIVCLSTSNSCCVENINKRHFYHLVQNPTAEIYVLIIDSHTPVESETKQTKIFIYLSNQFFTTNFIQRFVFCKLKVLYSYR